MASSGHRVVVLTPPGAGAIGVVRVVGPDAVALVNQAFHPASGGGLSITQENRLRYGHFVDGEEVIDDVIVCVATRHEGTEARRHEGERHEEKRHEGTKARRHGGERQEEKSHEGTEARSHELERHEGTEGRRHEGENAETQKHRNAETPKHRNAENIGLPIADFQLPIAEEVAVDISAHGGVRVIERILQTLERLGASVGEPGEAIELAWPTGSVIEHETIVALTRAKTERAVRFLAFQRENLPAELEAVASLCRSDPLAARLRLGAAADGFPVARTLIGGATVALVGPPNSGKSTLFNRLLGRPATVVSPQPGTTRDWVAEEVEMEGVPITLVDTAGRRESDDPLEQQAVEVGRKVVERADVRLLLLDGSQSLSQPGQELLETSRTWDGCVTVITKADAGSVWKSWNDTGGQAASGTRRLDTRHMVSVSGLTGAGCDELVSAILKVLGFRGWNEGVPCLFTARQAEGAEDILSVLPREPKTAEQLLERCLIGRYD